jgi:hypothetical protein
MSGEQYTDNDGYAEFDGCDDGEVTVYLNGTDSGTYQACNHSMTSKRAVGNVLGSSGTGSPRPAAYNPATG